MSKIGIIDNIKKVGIYILKKQNALKASDANFMLMTTARQKAVTEKETALEEKKPQRL